MSGGRQDRPKAHVHKVVAPVGAVAPQQLGGGGGGQAGGVAPYGGDREAAIAFAEVCRPPEGGGKGRGRGCHAGRREGVRLEGAIPHGGEGGEGRRLGRGSLHEGRDEALEAPRGLR